MKAVSAATLRQRRRRARLAQQAPPRQPIECHCCGKLFIPTRQGRYCSRQCIERAGAFRRRLKQASQRRAIALWLFADRSSPAGTKERSRLLQDHRHLLEPIVEEELIDTGWLYGPRFKKVEHSAMAQANPDQTRGG